MLDLGLIDEVAGLEYRYGRRPNSMHAIGIIEVLAYLDGMMDKAQMSEAIATHTAQLAKRQQTFNRHQFKQRHLLSVPEIYEKATAFLKQ